MKRKRWWKLILALRKAVGVKRCCRRQPVVIVVDDDHNLSDIKRLSKSAFGFMNCLLTLYLKFLLQFMSFFLYDSFASEVCCSKFAYWKSKKELRMQFAFKTLQIVLQFEKKHVENAVSTENEDTKEFWRVTKPESICNEPLRRKRPKRSE